MSVSGKLAFALVGLLAIAALGMKVAGSRKSTAKRPAVVDKNPRPPQERRGPLIERFRAPAPSVPPVAVAVPTDRNPGQAEAPESEADRKAEVATTLQAQYATDALPTRESADKEAALQALFSQPALRGKGSLEEVNCRQTVCRGVITIASEQDEREVFGATFLSPRFATTIRDAVTVTSRKKRSDGSVSATFFIYPQSVLDSLGP